jgi:hypothetical protein
VRVYPPPLPLIAAVKELFVLNEQWNNVAAGKPVVGSNQYVGDAPTGLYYK